MILNPWQQRSAPWAKGAGTACRRNENKRHSSDGRCAMAAFGRIDILVNNAGININKAALDMSEEEWDLVVDTNLKSYFLASQRSAVSWSSTKGKIINISSTFGLVGFERDRPMPPAREVSSAHKSLPSSGVLTVSM